MSSLTYNYSGQVALVAGGASGIGHATARAFAEAGAWVAVADMNVDQGLKTVHEIIENGGDAIFYQYDILQPESIKTLIEHIEKRMGSLSYAFNCVGTNDSSNCTECTIEIWDQVIDVVLRGALLSMKYEIPLILRSGGGAIVNCAPNMELSGKNVTPAYLAGEHGMMGLTKAMALEYSKKNIRINAICPAQAQPEEVAAAVLWLCSEQSSLVTGHSLTTEGRWASQ
ncbi:SDR family oxidoreductase [Bdellovibrio sp. NC01]|uniref:SDR family oxidoreductase n=1 Tax=Bdellovibrio sp. NC01 TaxID=2220073 RepID=UPI0011597AF3|nr:SDR family oxidoreductase [Bdellovibrio sp. NC01]QDK36462.1 hypothetical protein DOE51_02030 [Bdellovibrio sp. NC01]